MSPPDDGSTRRSLVDGLRDAADAAAWARFCERYRPRLVAACSRYGLQEADRDDAVAEVVARVVTAMRDGWVYDPSKSFRGWLTTLCHNESVRRHRQLKSASALGGVGTGVAEDRMTPDPPEAAEIESDWAELVRAAADAVQRGADPKTWTCFALNGVEKLPAVDVAVRLGLSPAAVWQNKCRVAQRIRDEVQRRLDPNPGEPESG